MPIEAPEQLLPRDQLTVPLRHVAEPSRIHARVMDVVNSRIDLVGPQSNLTVSQDCAEFLLRLDEPVILASGVADQVLSASYTRSAWKHVLQRLHIPIPFGDRLVTHDEDRVRQLASDNINVLADVDDRSALYRYLQTQEGLLLRAVRSDKFLMLDNDAALVAIVKGLGEHDLKLWDTKVDCDLTNDRMRLRMAVPEIAVNAKELLKDYRSPYDKRPGNELPMLFAGLEFSNSETGAGAFTMTPRAEFQICSNGVTSSIKFRRHHLGSSLPDGEIEWSHNTVSAALNLITSQVADTVRTYLNTDYLDRLVREMKEARGYEVEDIAKGVEVVQNRFKFSDAETLSILGMMTKSGDTSVFGLGQAVTAAAQEVEDTDRQAAMEDTFSAIIEAPATFATTLAGA